MIGFELDSGPLVSEAIALLAVPQPLPNSNAIVSI